MMIQSRWNRVFLFLIGCCIFDPTYSWKQLLASRARWGTYNNPVVMSNDRFRSATTPNQRFGYASQFATMKVLKNCRGGDDCANRVAGDEFRSELVTPFIDEPSHAAKQKLALILMDTFSPYHGMFLAHRAKALYGVTIIPVLSDYMKGFFQIQQPPDFDRLMSMCMPSRHDKESWLKPLHDYELVAVVCESDSGLPDAERLEALLNTTIQNGFNEARRNKYMMIEKIREKGIPAVRQKLCSSVEDAHAFALELGLEEFTDESSTSRDSFTSTSVVVKPVRGVGSEDVSLCQTMASVEKAFRKIHGGTVFGSPREKHQSVLVQEYAQGQEFAIDVVSKNGQHKVAAVWKYDKRPANGASFVYFATNLYAGDEVNEICDYLRQCLDALEISWGITHSEIIMTTGGPRLVEVNCRQHNMDCLPLTMECIGYNVFDMLLSAYLGDKDPDIFPHEHAAERLDWELLPLNPSIRMNGAMIHLVCFVNGTLAHLNEDALREIQNMDSVVDLEVYPPFLRVGTEIRPTIDIRTDAGWVQLVNPDPDQFQKDYDRIVELMPSIFEGKI